MNLKEFIETDIYKDAACISYIGADGMEIDNDSKVLLDCTVLDYYKSSGGYLEIKLDAI